MNESEGAPDAKFLVLLGMSRLVARNASTNSWW